MPVASPEGPVLGKRCLVEQNVPGMFPRWEFVAGVCSYKRWPVHRTWNALVPQCALPFSSQLLSGLASLIALT